MKILIVEDDPTLSKNICDALTDGNIHTEAVYNGVLAEKMLRKNHYDCVVLDVNLPGKTGLDICKDFRKHNSHTPILMLTAFGELDDKVAGFNAGADDYLTKPFYMRELSLRVNSLLKRKNHTPDISEDSLLTVNDIIIDTKTKKVSRQNIEINLTPREFQILLRLVKSKGELVSKNDLIKEIWGNSVDINTNTIEVFINFLRKKIDKPFGTESIKTKVGYGYYFE
ncbi:response regulator transcription factor [Pseudopedobacter sp.]|uniref:response regulator transcription factor n=1 Tax=Pseudopedobacter sp. TaxID=1936787 RepID=UPI00333F0A07